MAQIDYIAQATKASTAMQSALKIGVEKTLLENLQPRISQIISNRLQEMNDEGEDDNIEMDETIDVNALMQEVEDENAETPDLGEPEEGDDMGGEPEEGGEESIASMTPESLKQMIKDALQDILGDEQAGEVDSTDMDMDTETDAPTEDETEVDENDMYEGLDDIVNEIMADMGDEKPKDDSLQEQIKALKKENGELKKANGIYKNALNESKLSLVQLSYINGLIVESKLSNEQIIKFTEILEKTKTPQEAKNVYDAINESVKSNSTKSVIKTQKIKESYGLSSNKILPNKTQPKQEDPFVSRMRRNAGLS